MPVIVDANCIPEVFSTKSKGHPDFKPVFDWIVNGKGLMVTGGTKYKKELEKLPKFLRIINLLKDSGKVLVGHTEKIDHYQEYVEGLKDDDDFDDEHLPAMVVETKCRVICSKDTRSIPHVRDRKYYPKGMTLPSYYTSKKNVDLLCDKYVDDVLKPLCKLKKAEANTFQVIISKN